VLAACGAQGAKPGRYQADIFRLSFHPGLTWALELWLEWKGKRVAEVSALLAVLEVDTGE